MSPRPDGPSRLVFLVLDGLPPAVVGPDLTPTLVDWAAAAGTIPRTVPAVLPASTYPNHATFVTGVAPAHHGIVANHVRDPDGRYLHAADIGPRTPTIFDAASVADIFSELVVGDQNLVGVMGGRHATNHWPPDGTVPNGARLDAHGYLVDAVTLPELLRALDGDAELIVGHLNSPDTAGHVHGPETQDARDVYHAVDASLAEVRAAIEPRADDTVTLVVSDHSMEPVTIDEPVDLSAALDGTGVEWFPEGTAALVYGEHPDIDALLTRAPGVGGMQQLAPAVRVAWAEPGRWLCFHGIDSEPGMHGSPRTAPQLATVLGAHPTVRDVDARVATDGFDARSWAPTIARLLGFRLS